MCLPSLAGTVWGTELNSSKYLMKIKNIFVRFIFSGEQLLYPWISRSLISTNVLEIISLQMLSREHTSVMTRLLMWVFEKFKEFNLLHKYFFSSVCQFKAEVSRLEATNACANKDMNILLRILLTTLTDRGWMQSSRAWWRANPTGSTCTNVVLLVSLASHPPSPSRCLLPSSASSSDPSSTDREKAWNLFCCDSSQILT